MLLLMHLVYLRDVRKRKGHSQSHQTLNARFHYQCIALYNLNWTAERPPPSNDKTLSIDQQYSIGACRCQY